MKKITIIIFFSLFIFGCSEEISLEKPKKEIDKETFANIIYDISLLEGHMASYNLNQEVFKDSSRQMYQAIFDKYKINKEDFKENNDYYLLTEEYQAISNKVLERIKIEELKYKDVKPFTTISFVQFNQLLEKDNFVEFFKKDTMFSYQKKIDSVLNFYRKNSHQLASLNIDSLNFELNIKNIRRNKKFYNMFEKEEVSIFKKQK